MRDNPFYSPRLLIADARDDIYSLNEAVRDFVRHRETLIPHFDLEQRLYVYTVQFGKPLSPKLPVLMRKAVGSLRAALDQAVYASAVTLGSPRLVSTNFPFANTAQELEGDIKRKCRDVDPEIVTLLRTFQSYQGGNVTLWTLNKLRNIKEHRLLVPSVVAGGLRFNIRAEGELLDAVLGSREQDTNWDPMNKKLVFTLPGIALVERQNEVKITFYIVFGEIDCVRGMPVVPMLYDFASTVETCVTGIEAEIDRLMRRRHQTIA